MLGRDLVTHREFELEQRRLDNLREADTKAVLAALNSAEKAVDAALAAAEKATSLVRDQQKDKNEAQNEWRDAMTDLIAAHKEALAVIVATLVTKDELGLRLDAISATSDARKERIEARLTTIEEANAATGGEKRGSEAQILDRRETQNTSIAAAALTAQIRGLYIAVVAIFAGGAITILVDALTHGFR